MRVYSPSGAPRPGAADAFAKAGIRWPAALLIMLNFNAYAAWMHERGLSRRGVVLGMGLDRMMEGMPWPEALPHPDPYDVLEQILQGDFIPNAQMDLEFCRLFRITPDQLLPSSNPDPAPPEKVEAAIAYALDLRPCPLPAGLAAFLRRETMRADMLAGQRLTPVMATNREFMAAMEQHGASSGLGLDVFQETTTSIDDLRDGWMRAARTYHSHLALEARRWFSGLGPALSMNKRDRAITRLQDFAQWAVAVPTDLYLRAEANRRNILGHLDREELGMGMPDGGMPDGTEHAAQTPARRAILRLPGPPRKQVF